MLEAKLDFINRTSSLTTISVRLYRTSGPTVIIDSRGIPRNTYKRDLLSVERLEAGSSDKLTSVVTALRSKLQEYNNAHGDEFAQGDISVSFSKEATGFG